jgi:hypothetical protein
MLPSRTQRGTADLAAIFEAIHAKVAATQPVAPAMPKKKSAASPSSSMLLPEEMRVLEKLVASGVLIAVPPKRMGKPRPVISASLTPGSQNILLYLSQEPAQLDE